MPMHVSVPSTGRDHLTRRCERNVVYVSSGRPGARDAGFVREDDDLDAVADTELREDASDVTLHGGLTEVELVRELSIRETARDQSHDAELAFGQARGQPPPSRAAVAGRSLRSTAA